MSPDTFKLSHHIWQKRHFDPKSKTDMEEYAYFLQNRRWRERCPFILEWPHLNITALIKDRILDTYFPEIIKGLK